MSMHGKVVVITGSNVGIGLETAVGLAERGATTVLACRNQAKAEAAAKVVTQRTWNDDVHVVALDLADLASVRKAADDILSRWGRLDVLVNNAGRDVDPTPAHGAGHRVHVRREPPGPLLPDQPSARAAVRRRARPRRQCDLGRPPRGIRRDALRRPAEREALRGHGGLLPFEAGQRPLHSPVGQAPGRRAGSRPMPPTRAGCGAASPWTATSRGSSVSACG